MSDFTSLYVICNMLVSYLCFNLYKSSVELYPALDLLQEMIFLWLFISLSAWLLFSFLIRPAPCADLYNNLVNL